MGHRTQLWKGVKYRKLAENRTSHFVHSLMYSREPQSALLRFDFLLRQLSSTLNVLLFLNSKEKMNNLYIFAINVYFFKNIRCFNKLTKINNRSVLLVFVYMYKVFLKGSNSEATCGSLTFTWIFLEPRAENLYNFKEIGKKYGQNS